MHIKAAEQLVESVRRRTKQGDHPTEPALSVEALEDLVVTLADQLAAARRGAGDTGPKPDDALADALTECHAAMLAYGFAAQEDNAAEQLAAERRHWAALHSLAAHPEGPQHGR